MRCVRRSSHAEQHIGSGTGGRLASETHLRNIEQGTDGERRVGGEVHRIPRFVKLLGNVPEGRHTGCVHALGAVLACRGRGKRWHIAAVSLEGSGTAGTAAARML